MIKFLIKIVFAFYILINSVYANQIKDVIIKGNDRISKQTILTYGQIKIDKVYETNDLNEIFKNLYETNFFKDLKIYLDNENLIIEVVENKIIQNVIVEGVKSKTIVKSIKDSLFSKDKSPFLMVKVKNDEEKLKKNLNYLGYYFANVVSEVKENNNNTVDLIFNIDLGEKAKIEIIDFIGDKKFKDRTLKNIIISEESKFWKFISKNKFLNKSIIDRDIRLLENFYLNRGYYDVKITSSVATYIKSTNSFQLIYKIDAGNLYEVSKTELILPIDYNPENFVKVEKRLDKLNNESYSLAKISKIVEEIDKVSLSREYDFINAEVIENKISENKIEVVFKIVESEKFYVNKINIFGNNITQENVIRNSLEIDEGDPFNELLNAKSINNLRSLNIFKSVKSNVTDGETSNTKNIDIEVEEKPTGEITLGAGASNDGGTLGFGITENNFLGKGVKLGTSFRLTNTTIRGNFAITNPNFNYSNKKLITNIESVKIDKMSENGYETTKTGFSLGTGYEQYEDIYFRPSISTYMEDLTTSSKASSALKKQSGSYFESKISYSFDLDKRNQRFQTSDGHRFIFSQGIPLYSEEYSLSNTINTEKWYKFENGMITNFGFYGKMINSLNGEDVRVTDRLSIPKSKLKGFNTSKIGPVDNGDYVGGNYVSSINFDTTLPMIFPGLETVDFKYFIDAANVWGIDYSDTIDDSNKIRSSTGVGVDWFTPIGPMNFSISQAITKASSDKTEGFQFNLGTTF